MAQKVATEQKLKLQQTTTLMEKLKFWQGQAIQLPTATRSAIKQRHGAFLKLDSRHGMPPGRSSLTDVNLEVMSRTHIVFPELSFCAEGLDQARIHKKWWPFTNWITEALRRCLLVREHALPKKYIRFWLIYENTPKMELEILFQVSLLNVTCSEPYNNW